MDETQSAIRYPNFEDWINNFLFTSIRKCISVLSQNGYFIINIKDNNNYPIVKRMIDFIETFGLKKIKDIIFIHSKRHAINKTFEYIYVFQNTRK